MARLLAAFVVVGVCLWTQVAHAAACCSSATVSGVGRLLVWENAAAGITLGASTTLGRWGPDRSWRPYPAEYRERELAPSAWGIVRLSERVELQAKVPWIINIRSSGDTTATGHGAGDALLAGRYEITGVGEYLHIPAIALTAGVLLPTGRREEDALRPFAADATGRGAWEGSLALSVEQTWKTWFLRLDAGARASLPFKRPDRDVTQRYGPGASIALTGGKEVLPGLSLALVVDDSHEGVIHLGGERVEGSSSHGLAATGAVSWRFLPHWTAQAALTCGVYTSGFGANRAGRFTTTWGLRYGFF